jgi:hypothetical protein
MSKSPRHHHKEEQRNNRSFEHRMARIERHRKLDRQAVKETRNIIRNQLQGLSA